MGLCKRTGFLGVKRRENPVRLHILPSALPPKGEARHYVANDSLNLIAFPSGIRFPVTPVRAASPPWQMERENEMIVISHRLSMLIASHSPFSPAPRLLIP